MKLAVAAAVAVPLLFAAGAVVPAAMAAGPTASQLASKANADLKAARTYRLSSTIGSGKDAVSTKVTRGSNGCEISLTSDGSTVGFIQIGSTTWTGVSGIWVSESTSQAGGALAYCNAHTVATLVPAISGLNLGPVTKVNGQRVQELKGDDVIMYVTTGAKPELVRYQLSGKGQDRGQYNFSGINVPVRVSPPSGDILGS
jgi:hypothetical protein